MKNAINYYYSFNVDKVHFYHQKYYFKNGYQDYVLQIYNRAKEEMVALYELNLFTIKQDPNYHQIILNKEKSPVTVIDNIPYILLKIGNNSNYEIELNNIYPLTINLSKEYEILVRSSWVNLWSEKIDYIEYQLEHLELEFPILISNIWYFIGLGENAITYVQETILEEKPTEYDQLVVSHRRVTSKDSIFDYYNPISLIIDHQVRDIAEYLKSYFIEDKYDMSKIEEYFEGIYLSSYGYRMLFGRMLFPSFYFDLYDKIINHKTEEKEIIFINNRMKEYESYLNQLYYIIKRYTNLPEVGWLNKKM